MELLFARNPRFRPPYACMVACFPLITSRHIIMAILLISGVFIVFIMFTNVLYGIRGTR